MQFHEENALRSVGNQGELHQTCCLMCMYAEWNRGNTRDATAQRELHHACCLMCRYPEVNQNNTSDAISLRALHHVCRLMRMYPGSNRKTRGCTFHGGIVSALLLMCMCFEGKQRNTSGATLQDNCTTLGINCVCMPKAIKETRMTLDASRIRCQLAVFPEFHPTPRFLDILGLAIPSKTFREARSRQQRVPQAI